MLWGEFPKESLPYIEAMEQGVVSDSEQRAVTLLRSVISAYDFNRYLATGTLPALGQITGTYYLIRRGETTLAINSMEEATHSYCIHSAYDDKVPKTDDVIAVWLMITGFESRFLDVSNRSNQYHEDAFRTGPSIVPPSLFEENPETAHYGDATETIQLSLDDINCYEVEEAETELCPPLTPPEIIFIDEDEEDDTVLMYRTRMRTARAERTNGLAYDMDIQFAEHQLWDFESSGVAPTPTLNSEDKLITQGIGMLCLYADLVTHPSHHGESTFVDYDSPEGDLRIPLRAWNSWRDLDDTIIGSLLDAYVQRLHSAIMSALREDAESEHEKAKNEEPRSPLTKCIMSAEVYRRLTGQNPLFTPLRYQQKAVIIDDRVGDIILMFADAVNLGAIPHISDEGLYGIAILEPINVIAYRLTQDAYLYRIGYEEGVDLIYGLWPDNNPAVMDYQQFRFLDQSTIHLEEVATACIAMI